ncbi:hypothetical protein AD953_05995 [Acetobacter malorum]|uniref:Uncharacterized protein n=1 Tax=Acetobacter malorum TaxID=178901 RepID=A0A149V6P6_9PROT|nr:helix-turn-helix domain-containing protein [Acetobacter malorum]KXV75901.1 hypothetical protein AD953_05995 [Acetobacter malorum]
MRLDQEQKAEILKLHAQGKTCVEISQQVSFSHCTIRSFIKRSGLPINIIRKGKRKTETRGQSNAPKLSRNSEPMRTGHPTAINTLWAGMERWRSPLVGA